MSLLLTVQALYIFLAVPLINTRELNPAFIGISEWLIAILGVLAASAKGIMRWVIIVMFVARFLLFLTIRYQLGLPADLLSFSAPLFYLAVIIAIAQKIFTSQHVTYRTIEGAVVVYLGIGLVFASIFMNMVKADPAAISNISPSINTRLGDIFYFSFSTLTTIGYGDAVPVHPMARSLANLESICGQLFLAVVIARLVGLHVVHADMRGTNTSSRS